MTLLVTVQVLFVISVILFLTGLVGVMIENETEARWMAPLLTGAAFAVLLGLCWGMMEPRTPCCQCPAEQTQR